MDFHKKEYAALMYKSGQDIAKELQAVIRFRKRKFLNIIKWQRYQKIAAECIFVENVFKWEIQGEAF